MSKTHGMSKTDEYKTWKGMRKRCLNKKCQMYEYYGGRGIVISEEWNDFMTFYEDMGPRPSKEYSIDRIDNDGNYCKENCRWATKKEQMNNRKNSVSINFNNESHSIPEWAKILNLDANTLYARYEYGWDAEKILTTPIATSSRNTRFTLITYEGLTLSIADWSRKTGINYSTIRERYRKNLPLEQIFYTGHLIKDSKTNVP